MESNAWTMPKVIGHNVRKRRDELGITAAALGEQVGNVFGKIWPRQTVYMMEAGDRSMIASEVAALAHILTTTPAALLTPPLEAERVTVGTLDIDRSALILDKQEDSPAETVLQFLRGLQRSQAATSQIVQDQGWLLLEAENALRGHAAFTDPGTPGPSGDLHRANYKRAMQWLDAPLSSLDQVLEGDDDGRG